MNKGKHLQPKDYDQIIAFCLAEPEYNITAYLESQFLEYNQSNTNFMQGLEDAFDREDGNPKYNNVKIAIAANKGQLSDPRIDKLKIIATWGELKKQAIELERNSQILKQAKQGLQKIEKGLFEAEKAPDFRSMFVVDPTPCTIKKGESFTSVLNIEKQHLFNISNRQTVDESGVIIRDNYFRYYISELILLLSERLKASEITNFLNYHYSNATNKTGLLSFISCDLWDYISEPDILSIRKEKIMQWAANLSQQQDNSTQPEGLTVDDILNNMFTLTTSELENFKNNLLNKGRQYISLTYIGSKASLWNELGKLLSVGIDRKEITRVFSEYCYWQKSTSSPPEKLDPNEIYKKIAKKGTK